MLLVVADVAVAQFHSAPSDPSLPSLDLKGTGQFKISSSLFSISSHDDDMLISFHDNI